MPEEKEGVIFTEGNEMSPKDFAVFEKALNAALDRRNEPLPSPRWDETTRKILGY
jgi:hypothetical protein